MNIFILHRRMMVLRNRHPLNHLFFISSQHFCSSISSSNPNEAPKPHFSFLVNFLINSVGFTKEAAIITSSKVPSLKSTKNPELVINILKQHNLDNTHIRDIIFFAPKILSCRPSKTLEPKVKFFKGHGFSGSDFVQLMKANPGVLNVGLHTRIIPLVNFLRRFIATDEEVFEFIRKTKWLFYPSHNFKRLSDNVITLQNRGLSNEQIATFISRRFSGAFLRTKDFECRLVWIVNELGIPENSRMFVYAVYAILRLDKSIVEKKFDVLREYNWSEEDIATFGRVNPFNLVLSEAKIRAGLDFFMKELGYTPSYLVTHHSMLRSSLEKTVKPRYKVLEILKENKLVSSKPSLAAVVAYSESLFLKFVKRYENELPGLAESYINSVQKTKGKYSTSYLV
ncbi:mitochodrial transcription termination factor [Artemisia annua]|uniref:Mitochodrial transcription termination factor n=1 Tax=Artemisia annua TaxID=35608 RepID=A0A2U1MXL5_ARTAN|nr:mitochodrial transcription termination factor [Artemisia annua]